MARTDHFDPHASDVMNMRREHSNGPARITGNTLRPQLGRQVLDEIRRYAVVCTPRVDQRLSVCGIFHVCTANQLLLRRIEYSRCSVRINKRSPTSAGDACTKSSRELTCDS